MPKILHSVTDHGETEKLQYLNACLF